MLQERSVIRLVFAGARGVFRREAARIIRVSLVGGALDSCLFRGLLWRELVLYWEIVLAPGVFSRIYRFVWRTSSHSFV